MTKGNCGIGLLRKPCPRKTWRCRRCAEKLQNSETVWELTVPTYKDWNYYALDPPTGGPTGQVKIYTDYKPIPQDPDGTLSNCRFEGDNLLSFVPDPSDSSAAGWPDWVQDLENALSNVPFTLAGSDPPRTSWQSFYRYHQATVSWAESELDGSKVKTPGEWRINLNIDQTAFYVLPDFEATIIWLDDVEWYIDTVILGNYRDPADFIVILGSDVYTAVESPLRGTFYPPDDFHCPILDGATYRFTRRLPTNIFPTTVTEITINDLPAGYDWPWWYDPYEKDIHGNLDPTKPRLFSGTIYPTGFTRGDYIGPPYIDVRHVKRSEIDVRKSITQ